MKYIKLFDTHSEYEAAESSLILPNVSFCKDTANEVHYNPYVPYDPYNGHEYVDLGLSSGTKWATMNVGATSETEYGNYYKYGKGSNQYDYSDKTNYSGNEEPLAASADTAAQEWGGEWHMPTEAQLRELTANTAYQWVTNYNDSGISGIKFTSKTDSTKYIFIPAAGYYQNGNRLYANSYCKLWSSSPSSPRAIHLFFRDGYKTVDTELREYGLSIRGVVG